MTSIVVPNWALWMFAGLLLIDAAFTAASVYLRWQSIKLDRISKTRLEIAVHGELPHD